VQRIRVLLEIVAHYWAGVYMFDRLDNLEAYVPWSWPAGLGLNSGQSS